MLGVAVIFILVGENVKFPVVAPALYVPVKLQLPPLVITRTSDTLLWGCPDDTFNEIIGLTYCQVVDPL